MALIRFDPNANKVKNAYGGFDPNEKGLVQYPKVSNQKQAASVSFGGNRKFEKQLSDDTRRFSHKCILDPATAHYQILMQDPSLSGARESLSERKGIDNVIEVDNLEIANLGENVDESPCGVQRLTTAPSSSRNSLFPPMKKPIDPIHWKPDLFDTKFEKYYLRNLLIEDPYREFLTSCSEATSPQHYCSEYRQSYSGNPALTTSSSGRIFGISRPTDMPEPCYWKRYRTQKLRDVIFTHEKNPVDSHLDYNDPKRYNPWPRQKMSYDQMIEGNYRPKPLSGVEYSVTTLLPAVSTLSKQWII